MLVITVAFPSVIFPSPTSVPLAYISIGPFGTFSPVTVSVTVTSTVTFCVVVLVTSVTISLSRLVTLILKVSFIALYVSLPG